MDKQLWTAVDEYTTGLLVPQDAALDAALADLAMMEARLGMTQELAAHLSLADKRAFFGSNDEKIKCAHEGLATMKTAPQIAFWESALQTAVGGDAWHAELARHHWVDTYLGAAATRDFLDRELITMRDALAALGLLTDTAA